ncbi:hypothetical protein BGZ68_008669 [Mortierella alpina]|nr:hypothetical protein BGZ68_008669 [Mortierella alpina]
MKMLISLSLASMMVSSVLAAMSVQEFVNDANIQALAPHLLQEINTQGIDAFNRAADPAPITAMLQIPLLDDLVKIVSGEVFKTDQADWSKLEDAKLKATEQHGSEAVAAIIDLAGLDTKQAVLICNTIFDTVSNIPAISKEAYAAKKKEAGMQKDADSSANTDNKDTKKPEEKKEDKGLSPITSTLLDILGFGLIKSSDGVRTIKGIVTPRAICETTDTAYLTGVDDVVYHSSLTHGIAEGALLSAPADAVIKSLDIQGVVAAISKLAIKLHLSQSVAQLAEKPLTDLAVRTMSYLAVAADSPTASWAQVARDINNLMQANRRDDIPESVLRAFIDQAALELVKGEAGQAGPPSLLSGIPIVRNIIAFSSGVLSSNNIGDVLKYVFCPEASQTTEAPKAETVVDQLKKGAEEAGQKVLKAPGEAADKLKDIKDEAAEAGAKVQDKVTEGTEKVNAAGEKVAEEVKKAAEDVADEAKKAADKAEEAKQEL